MLKRKDFINNKVVYEFKNVNPNIKDLRYVLFYKGIYYILDNDLLVFTSISIKDVNEWLKCYLLNNNYRYFFIILIYRNLDAFFAVDGYNHDKKTKKIGTHPGY